MAMPEEKVQTSDLRWLTDVFMQLQKQRIAAGNRLQAIKRQSDLDSDPVLVEKLHGELLRLEKMVAREMDRPLSCHSVWPWLEGVKGVGTTLATKLLGLIGDISSFDTVSKLWRFAGLAVIDGKAERLVRGEKAHYNNRLKTVMYLISDSFLKTNSPYRRIYDQAKERYKTTHPDWTDRHSGLAARRKMEKIFLSHLWEVWRKAEGLPTRDPYVQDYLGHTTTYRPDEFSGAGVGGSRPVDGAAEPSAD